MTKQVEVLIIGSGFGGVIAARRLAAAGRDVLMLELGPWRDTVPNRSIGLKNLVPLPQGNKALTHGLRTVGSHLFKKTFTFNNKGFIEAYAGRGGPYQSLNHALLSRPVVLRSGSPYQPGVAAVRNSKFRHYCPKREFLSPVEAQYRTSSARLLDQSPHGSGTVQI